MNTIWILDDEPGMRWVLEKALDKAGWPVRSFADGIALKEALDAAQNTGARFRRSLAGALVTLVGPEITVERAPPRRGRPLTTRGYGNAKPTKPR